jgi:two-component system nitrate/nitrite response regulator NarL
MDSENLYMISIFRGPSTRDDYNQNSQIKSMYNLTNREYEIVSLLQKGYSNEQIAEKLCITPRTVKAHLHSIFEKTGVNTRGKLIYKLS